jgi:aminoglycoside phosphotransferase (APT) family kinase protein
MARLDPLSLAATLPFWGGRVSPVPLPGGLTNDNFVVEDGGRRYVVRVGGDIPAHNIVRTLEAAASRAAHAAGVSPRVHYADSTALVIDFVDGRTLTPEDVRATENRARLVDLIKRAHREIPKHFLGPAPLFWVLQVVRHYDRVLRGFRSPHVSMLPALARMAERRNGRSARSTSSSATTTRSPPICSTTASASGWSIGNTPDSIRRFSTSAVWRRTAKPPAKPPST